MHTCNTVDQKARVMEAASGAREDMAAWARTILLKAAEDWIANSKEAEKRTE